jgi:hypothetical protein
MKNGNRENDFDSIAELLSHQNAAGPIRNKEMAESADALVAIPRPASKGAANMIKQAETRGLLVHVHEAR